MASKRAPQSWADMPLDVAGQVLCRLHAHVDRVRFAAVCTQWRAAAHEDPPPPPLPLIVLRDGTVYSFPGNEPFRLPSCAGYMDSCRNWLLFSHEDACFLRDPFSNATVTLPPLSRIRVRYASDELGPGSARLEVETQNANDLTLVKVIFCSPRLIAAFIRQGGNKVAVCQPGATSWWSMMRISSLHVLGDLTFYQGKLYALDYCKGDLFNFDISIDHRTNDPWVSQSRRVINGDLKRVTFPGPEYYGWNMLYLVELHGRLLMVRRSYYTFRTSLPNGQNPRSWGNKFEVFGVDFEQSCWSKVTNIGDDQVFFVQTWRCKSLCLSAQHAGESHLLPGRWRRR